MLKKEKCEIIAHVSFSILSRQERAYCLKFANGFSKFIFLSFQTLDCLSPCADQFIEKEILSKLLRNRTRDLEHNFGKCLRLKFSSSVCLYIILHACRHSTLRLL